MAQNRDISGSRVLSATLRGLPYRFRYWGASEPDKSHFPKKVSATNVETIRVGTNGLKREGA